MASLGKLSALFMDCFDSILVALLKMSLYCLEKIRTMSACEDSWMKACDCGLLWGHWVLENKEVSFLQCYPLHCFQLISFDTFLTSSWQLSHSFLFQLASQNATHDGGGGGVDISLSLSKLLHFSMAISKISQKKVVKKVSIVSEHHSNRSHWKVNDVNPKIVAEKKNLNKTGVY